MYRGKPILLLGILYLLLYPVRAAEEPVPDIALLEFLGTIAGLENMGIEIDLMLDNPEQADAPITDALIGNIGEDND